MADEQIRPEQRGLPQAKKSTAKPPFTEKMPVSLTPDQAQQQRRISEIPGRQRGVNIPEVEPIPLTTEGAPVTPPDYVLLETGEYINKEEFNKLPVVEQIAIIKMGVNDFNKYYNKKLIVEAGFTELPNGEYITTSEYNKLKADEQAKLREVGIDKFNVWYEEKKTVEAGYTKLDTGEWVTTGEYNKLSNDDKSRLKVLGIDKFNQMKGVQIQEQLKAAIKAASPKEVPITKGSGKWKDMPGSYFIRLPEGDMPAWLFIPDLTAAYTPSGGPIATSYGPELLGIKMVTGNQQEYKVYSYGYGGGGGYPIYQYHWKNKNGEDVWVDPDKTWIPYMNEKGESWPRAVDAPTWYAVNHPGDTLIPVNWTEETYLKHVGATKEDIPNRLLSGFASRYTDQWVNQTLGNIDKGEYIDPVTGEKSSTEYTQLPSGEFITAAEYEKLSPGEKSQVGKPIPLMSPYGLVDSSGKLVQRMGKRPIYGTGAWTEAAKQAYIGTDIGMVNVTGRITNYVTDPRSVKSKAAEVSQAAFAFKSDGKLPNFPMMKEVYAKMEEQMGTIFPVAAEPVPLAIINKYIDPAAKLDDKQLAILRDAVGKGLVSPDAKVTDVRINETDNTYNILSYSPQSMDEALVQLKKEGQVPEHSYVAEASYDNKAGTWIFQFGDTRQPQVIFDEMVTQGKVPQGSKMLGYAGKDGQYSFDYEAPESALAKQVKQGMAKYEYYDSEDKKWKIDSVQYAYDQWNQGKKFQDIVENEGGIW